MHSAQKKNGVPVPLSNSPQGPIWAYTGPEKRCLVRSRPEGSFCALCEPQNLAQCLGYHEYSICTCSRILNRLINYLEGRMKQKSRNLWFFTVNQRKLRLLWICNPWILVFFSHLLICYICFLFTHWLLEHIILRVMKNAPRWQKSRENSWMWGFPFLAVRVPGESNSTAHLWSFCRNHPQTGRLKCGQAERQCWLVSELQDLGTSAKTISPKSWDQKPENFISGKYFGVCGPWALSHNHTRLCHCSTNTATDSMSTSGHEYVPINLKFEFHLTSLCLQILPF